MGYWRTNTAGDSLLLVGDLNPDGTEMIFGDGPADALAAGLHALIGRLRADLGRFPTLAEVDQIKASAPEMVAAIAEAAEVFCQDIGRNPSAAELAAGLAFIDTAITLDEIERAEIGVGDVVRFALWRVTGSDGGREMDRFVDGVVEFSSGEFPQVMLDVRAADGELHHLEACHTGKVLPADEDLEELNARVRRMRPRLGPAGEERT
jgi:hypothetical protein